MANYTENLNLLKKDPATDGSDTFNIKTMLNDNWDKLDANVAAVAAELEGSVKKTGDTMTGNLAIANGNGFFESGIYNGFGFLKLIAVNGNDSTKIQLETGADRNPFIEHLVDGVAVSAVTIATATPPEEYDLPLEAGYTAIRACKFFKTQNGVVTVFGQGDAGDAIMPASFVFATLPAGYRPTHEMSSPITGMANSAYMAGEAIIRTTGEIELHGVTNCRYAYFSASFVAGN